MNENLHPKSDGTTSTNYGPSFEISTTAIFILRCLKNGEEFTVSINNTEYEPWDDIVSVMKGYTICVQLKHNEKLDKSKLKTCLDKRAALIQKHAESKLIFIFAATSPDHFISTTYTRTQDYPKELELLLTNKESVYFDQNFKQCDTYFCMNQDTVTYEGTNIKRALVDYIGQQYLSEEDTKEFQITFMDYMRNRYLRLIKASDPLVLGEIRRELSYAILNKFKLEYRPSHVKVNVSNNLDEVLGSSSIIAINHRWSSAFNEHIWYHLMLYLEKHFLKKHLKLSRLDELWKDGKIHMPLLSTTKQEDKTILRALTIGEFKPKVIILRPRVFNIKKGQEIITLLQNLKEKPDKMLNIKTREDIENFTYCKIDFTKILKTKTLKLHEDSFTEIFRNYYKNSSKDISINLVEAHDEFNYVNDFNYIDNKLVSAIFAAINIKDIPLNIIQQLIDLGSNVNAITENGLRPIFCAIEEDRLDIVELVLKNGADVNAADKDGNRPLFKACLGNKIEIAKCLVACGADRNAADFLGERPLFMAYNRGNFEILKIVLKNFENAAAANTQGSHILHKMAEDGSVEGLRCIIESCDDVNIFMTGDVRGKTPLDIARANGYTDFERRLQEAVKVIN